MLKDHLLYLELSSQVSQSQRLLENISAPTSAGEVVVHKGEADKILAAEVASLVNKTGLLQRSSTKVKCCLFWDHSMKVLKLLFADHSFKG